MPRTPQERLVDRVTLATLLLVNLVQWPGGIRWGDGLEFVAVAAGLDVAHPSGYPLYTLLGWLALKLPHAEPYTAVLWVSKASVFACGAGLYFWLKTLLAQPARPDLVRQATAGLFAVVFTFGGSLWPTLAIVEVYGFNAALLTWIAYLAGRPRIAGEPVSTAALLAASALFGLAVSNHLTAGCMAPLLIFTASEHFRARRRVVTIVAAAAVAVTIPLLLYGSLLARAPAGAEYGIAWGGTYDPAALVGHVLGGEYGSRTVLTQSDWLNALLGKTLLFVQSLGKLFFGGERWLPIFLGAAVMALTVVGGSVLGRDARVRRPGIFVLVAAALQLGFVLLYNIPDIGDYFLGVQLLLYPAIVVGIVDLWDRFGGEALRSRLPAIPAVLLIFAFVANYGVVYPRSAPIQARWLTRLLEQLPDRSTLITESDPDLFSMWYVQLARGERRDVVVYHASMGAPRWFRQSIPPGPGRDAVEFTGTPFRGWREQVEEIRRDVIEPMLLQGRVFTTLRSSDALGALAEHYVLRPAAELLTPTEVATLTEEIPYPLHATLHEIEPRGDDSTEVE